MSEQVKQEIKEEMKVDNYELKEPQNNYAYYSCDITDVILRKTEPLMDKEDYLQSFRIMTASDKPLTDKYKVYDGPESNTTLI